METSRARTDPPVPFRGLGKTLLPSAAVLADRWVKAMSDKTHRNGGGESHSGMGRPRIYRINEETLGLLALFC